MAAQRMPARAPVAATFSKGRGKGNPGSIKPVTVTPATIGGAFTPMVAYFPAFVAASGDGGRINQSGYVGSGTSFVTNGWYVSDGSATGVSETWALLEFGEDLKRDIWSGGYRDFALGSCEPHPGIENQFVEDTTPHPPAPVPVDYVAFYNNDFEAGLVGPSQTALRHSGNWATIQNQPAPGTTDLTAVKCYPGNQVAFPYPAGPPISAFKSIKGYANVVNPAKAPNPNIIYEAAWDIYGFAHWDRNGGNPSLPFISFECMFWTYDHNQSPYIGPLVETNVDLDDGRGPVWDLFMTADTATTGGINDRYSYFIFYLPDAYQGDAQWVNILAGIRYAAQYYVVTTGGAPANPLNIPLYQVTRGWEVCSTNFQPMEFQMLDYRIVMT